MELSMSKIVIIVLLIIVFAVVISLMILGVGPSHKMINNLFGTSNNVFSNELPQLAHNNL